MIICSVIAFSSCKKKDISTPITVQNVAGVYKLTSSIAKDANGNSVDVLANEDPCEQDDLDVLYASQDFEHQDAGIQCTFSDAFTGTWSVTANTITINSNTYNIISFNGKVLTINSTQTDNNTGISYKVTETFTKQ